jgi:cytochrome c biogenesis protein CcmG/thiol:disulfide interchange protein DsbE
MKVPHYFIAAATLLVTACSQAAPKDWVGKELPPLRVDFVDKDPDTKGKPQIVEFWATWCPPCRATIPHLNEINKKYQPQGLVVIGITDEDKKTVQDFRKKLPMEYNVAIDKHGLAEKLGITGIPHAFLVGKDGKVVWEGHPGGLTEAEVEKLVK